MPRLRIAFLTAVLVSACAMTPPAPPAPPAAVSDLAPTGKLRAVINLGNAVLAKKDAATGEPGGVSVDLARELDKRLGVPVELTTVTSPGQVHRDA